VGARPRLGGDALAGSGLATVVVGGARAGVVGAKIGESWVADEWPRVPQ
jgi:hypothetical protein